MTYAGRQNGSVVAYDPVTASNWYDADGNVIMSQAGGTQEFTKCQYDGMGQVIEEYTGYDMSTDTRGTYSEAVGGENGLSANDAIYEQTDCTYDPAGELTLTTSHQCYDDQDTIGALPGTPGRATPPTGTTASAARLPRPIMALHAPSDRSVYDRPAAVPAWNDNPDGVLVSATVYDDATGDVAATDNAGRVTETSYDAAGRVLETIENDVAGDTTDADANVTTSYNYAAGQQLATMTVATNGAPSQTTQYIYGTDVSDNGAVASPEIHDNDLLWAVIYADSGNTFIEPGARATRGGPAR